MPHRTPDAGCRGNERAAGGRPGAIRYSGAPASTSVVDTGFDAFGCDIYQSTLTLASPFNAAGGTTYWVSVVNATGLGGDWAWVTAEVRTVNDACTSRGALLKVIFENDYLSEPQIIQLCTLCTELGVAFVKTSTGYGFVKQPDGNYNYLGATDAHLRLMRRHSGPAVQLKAAGGVRSLDDLLRVRALGVTRIGATATETILAEAGRRGFPGPVPPGLAGPAVVPAPAAGY